MGEFDKNFNKNFDKIFKQNIERRFSDNDGNKLPHEKGGKSGFNKPYYDKSNKTSRPHYEKLDRSPDEKGYKPFHDKGNKLPYEKGGKSGFNKPYYDKSNKTSRPYYEKLDRSPDEKGYKPFHDKGNKLPHEKGGKSGFNKPYYDKSNKTSRPYYEKGSKPFSYKGKRPYYDKNNKSGRPYTKGGKPYYYKGKKPYFDKGPKSPRVKDWAKINERERLFLSKQEQFYKDNPRLAVGPRWESFRRRWDRYQYFHGDEDLKRFCDRVYIKFTLNNVFITLTNSRNKALYTISSGVLGFRGKKKVSINAVYNMTRALSYKCLSLRITKLVLYFDYVLRLRHYLLRPLLKGLLFNNVEVGGIVAYLGLSHNGLRKRKQRRK